MSPQYCTLYGVAWGLDSDWLRSGRSGDRIPLGAIITAPAQTGPGVHPDSYTSGPGSFPGVKRSGRGVDHKIPSSAGFERIAELYISSPSGPSWSLELYLYLLYGLA